MDDHISPSAKNLTSFKRVRPRSTKRRMEAFCLGWLLVTYSTEEVRDQTFLEEAAILLVSPVILGPHEDDVLPKISSTSMSQQCLRQAM